MVGTRGMPSGLGLRFRLGSSGRSCCSCPATQAGAPRQEAAPAAPSLGPAACLSFPASPTDMVTCESRPGAANGGAGFGQAWLPF